jgi:two-component system, OmpR family, phosphate regulon response regulator OmpR
MNRFARNNPSRLLLLDDNYKHRTQLTRCLVDYGYVVEEVFDYSQLQRSLQMSAFDLLILSLMASEEDSISIVKRLRAQEEVVPIIVLSAFGDTVGRILCLELGADDCLQLPYEPREFLARIGVILRRVNHRENDRIPRASTEVTLGDALIDLASRRVHKHGLTHDVTTREFNLLQTFLSFPNRPMSRERLLELAHGSDIENNPRSLDVQVMRLRKIVELNPKSPRYIQTVWGMGYVYVPD